MTNDFAEGKPKRKRQRLSNYDYSQNGLYFITICAKSRDECFGKIVRNKKYSEEDIEIIDYISDLNSGNIVGVDAYIDPGVLGFNPYIVLSPIGKIVDKYIRNIPGITCYCIMPDHLHLIIDKFHAESGSMWASTPTNDVPQLIKSFKILVTKEIGYSVWQRSYYDHIIRDQRDYFTRFRYIANNAAKWAMQRGIE